MLPKIHNSKLPDNKNIQTEENSTLSCLQKSPYLITLVISRKPTLHYGVLKVWLQISVLGK